jgi:hypothetical protein
MNDNGRLWLGNGSRAWVDSPSENSDAWSKYAEMARIKKMITRRTNRRDALDAEITQLQDKLKEWEEHKP